MKLCCISDTHGQWRRLKIPAADILIHAGDITAYGTVNELIDFNLWLGQQPCKYKLVIGGNHDRCLDESQDRMSDIQDCLSNGIYLQNTGCEIQGKKFWGSPFTPTFNDWFFMKHRDQIGQIWALVPTDTDVLITHGPPYGILDRVYYPSGRWESVGDEALREQVIQHLKPRYHLFGHLHDSHGKERIGQTTFINCSVLDDAYELVYKPSIVTLRSHSDR